MKLELRKSLGSAVRRQREKLGLSQEQLAQRADLHRTYVSDVERGARNLSFDSIYALAMALEIQASTLFATAELDAFRAAGEGTEPSEPAIDPNRTD